MLTIYTKPVCPQCETFKRLLTRRGIEFEAIDISENEELRNTLMSLGFKSLPVAKYRKQYASGVILGDPKLLAMLSQVRDDFDAQPSAPSM